MRIPTFHGLFKGDTIMSKVLIYTCAYNAENTIKRTIKSILAQTHSDWVYYIVDNGSTDKTGAIIREYAEHDARIVVLANRINHDWEPGNGLQECVESNPDCDYFCWLDADDEYKEVFIKKSIAFIQQNKLDIAISGSDFIDTQTQKIIGVRVITQSFIIEQNLFSDMFTIYHQFIRTVWGKLFSSRVISMTDPTNVPAVGYGWDTLFTQEMLRNSIRVGFLAESLHKYYVSPKSVSYRWEDKRIESDRILDSKARQFLLDKCGTISPPNNEFLIIVYMYALIDTFNVLINSDMDDGTRLENLCDMFLCDQGKQLAAWEFSGTLLRDINCQIIKRNELFLTAAEWLLSREDVADEQVEKYCDLGEFLCAASESAKGWVFFNKLRVQYLVERGRFDEARPKIEELLGLLPNDDELIHLLN